LKMFQLEELEEVISFQNLKFTPIYFLKIKPARRVTIIPTRYTVSYSVVGVQRG